MRVLMAAMMLVVWTIMPAAASLITFNEAGLVPGYGPDPWFSGSPKGTILTTQLASQGILFSTDSKAVAYISNQTYIPSGPSTGNFLTVNTVPILGPEGALTVSFVSPSNPATPGWVDGLSVSFYIRDSEEGSPRVLVTTYNYSGTQLEQWGLTAFDATHAFTTGQINRIVFTDTGGDGHILDSLAYGAITEVVPEPGTFALLSTGLIGLGLALRRRRAAR
jgi:hypothetical protein